MSTVTANVYDSQRLHVFARRSAAIGAVAWLLLLLTTTSDSPETELIHKVVFFAVLVIVPLGLSLVTVGEQRISAVLFRAAVLVQPVAAAITIASFFFEKGLLSASLAAVWLVISAIVALLGLSRFTARGLYPLHESSIDAGLLYLPVAGGWLIIYRLGVQPFAYGETIILLTVIHFHFAGFAAPIIAGLTGKMLVAAGRVPRGIYAFIVFAIVAAMPLVAAGITFSPWAGLAGTLLLTSGLVLLAVLTLARVVPAISSLSARLLLSIAALSSCTAMVLACLYAYSLVAHVLILRIPTMAMTHGLLNAFGFATCSLLAWSNLNAKN
ncbi:MAG TPA: YndJ family protein [Pyrinomonadaceae bacterium]|nr:YndJ family protein [Pyrinomonadaceae bacterium]